MIPDDLATWMYAFGFVVKGYGAGLFFWWLAKNEWEGSAMFMYVLILLFGSALRDGIETYGGFCRGTLGMNLEQMRHYVYDTWFWPARMILPNAAFAVLVVHMSYRAFWQRRHKDDG